MWPAPAACHVGTIALDCRPLILERATHSCKFLFVITSSAFSPPLNTVRHHGISPRLLLHSCHRWLRAHERYRLGWADTLIRLTTSGQKTSQRVHSGWPGSCHSM